MKQVEIESAGNDFGGHGFTCATGAAEHRGYGESARGAFFKSPLPIDQRALANVGHDLPQGLLLRLRQDEVVPLRAGLNAARQLIE